MCLTPSTSKETGILFFVCFSKTKANYSSNCLYSFIARKAQYSSKKSKSTKNGGK